MSKQVAHSTIDEGEFEIIIKESNTGKLYFNIIFNDYTNRRERKGYTHSRSVIPYNDTDFLDYLYEFTRFWCVSPVAENEYIAERIISLINEKPVKFFGREYSINWDSQYFESKEKTDAVKRALSQCIYNIDDVIRMLKESGIEDITARTIRFYETEGLLPKPLRKGKFKMYSLDTINRIRQIKDLQGTKKTLKEIRSDFEKQH